jgi:hypothetical protein
MRLGLLLLAVLLPVTLTVPAAPRWVRSTAPDDAPGSLCPPVALTATTAAAAQSGCCHFAGGICGCKGGRAQCCKGDLASSCPCGARATSDAPPTRGPGRDGPPLKLKRAAFTDKTTGPPLLKKTTTKAGEPVWLWIELDCPNACVNQLVTPEDPALKLSVYWYFDPGSGPILRDDLKVDQSVAPEPQPPRVVIPVALGAGNWVAEIGYGADRVCLDDETTCAFRIRVTK